ncbi:hypothetical protein LTR05_006088 [Lithohypha guttulata]|uniref:Uncharacterized protein n=1 Tax=Lithohypha guttulata TaxID=1690604 RepID=A0AAN7SXV9_9EURO|nr:hypothetical protein LTR05_006088 [Lithohypha guttulata]
MFENKDANSIRSIQTRLQCCGLNSMHDRAWPFPSRGVDARACERNQGYTVACGNMWRQEESLAATLTAIASFLNWLMVTLIVAASPESEGQIRLPEWSSSRPTHLIEAGEDHEESSHQRRTTTEVDSEEERIWNQETQNGR